MRFSIIRFKTLISGGLTVLLFSSPSQCADFYVETPGDFYTFNGDPSQSPILTLTRGVTYTFEIDARFDHPFYISPEDGVFNNNIWQGTLYYTPPLDAANDTVTYICYIHGWGNQIQFVDPPAPPEVKIVSFSIGTNVTVKSTGTNTWDVIPEYSTNLLTDVWLPLTVQTNHYTNGINETICGRPSNNPVFVRIRAQQQPTP